MGPVCPGLPPTPTWARQVTLDTPGFHLGTELRGRTPFLVLLVISELLGPLFFFWQ